MEDKVGKYLDSFAPNFASLPTLKRSTHTTII